MTKPHVAELVKWQANANVSDAQMVEAVDGLLPDLQQLPGFINQTLYKDKDGIWVDLYFWETEEQAIASNGLMANKASFANLMSLLDLKSVSIEFLYLPE